MQKLANFLLKQNVASQLMGIAILTNKSVSELSYSDVEPYNLKQSSYYKARKEIELMGMENWKNTEKDCSLKLQNSKILENEKTETITKTGTTITETITENKLVEQKPTKIVPATTASVVDGLEIKNPYSSYVVWTYYPHKVIDPDTRSDIKDSEWLVYLRDNVPTEVLELLWSYPYSEAAEDYLRKLDPDDRHYIKHYAKSVRLNKERLEGLDPEVMKRLTDGREQAALVEFEER